MGLIDLRVGPEAGGNFTRFNAITSELDLIVNPADEFIVAILIQLDEVSSPVVPLAVIERAVDEFFSRQLPPIPISDRDSDTANVKLTRFSRFHGSPVGVTDAETDIANRFSNRRFNAGTQVSATCRNGGFGWAVSVDQSNFRADLRKPRLDQRWIGFLSAKHDRLHRRGQLQ